MRLFKYRNQGKTRIWPDLLPDAVYEPSSWIENKIDADISINPVVRVATIELVAGFGPRIMYGLLGAKFEPNSTGQLTIEVGVSQSDGRLLKDNIMWSYDHDKVRIGLPEDYPDAVIDGFLWHRESLLMLGSGNLTVSCAAHGPSGSCYRIFKNLAISLVRLLLSHVDELIDEDIIRIIPVPFE